MICSTGPSIRVIRWGRLRSVGASDARKADEIRASFQPHTTLSLGTEKFVTLSNREARHPYDACYNMTTVPCAQGESHCDLVFTTSKEASRSHLLVRGRARLTYICSSKPYLILHPCTLIHTCTLTPIPISLCPSNLTHRSTPPMCLTLALSSPRTVERSYGTDRRQTPTRTVGYSPVVLVKHRLLSRLTRLSSREPYLRQSQTLAISASSNDGTRRTRMSNLGIPVPTTKVELLRLNRGS